MYVPRINTLGTSDNYKFIIETRKNIIWQVAEFDTVEDAYLYSQEKEDFLRENGVLALAIHIKYPILLMCIQAKDVKISRLEKLGELACDWYVQFWLENKKLSKPKIDPNAPIEEKAKAHFTHWVWGNNFLCKEEYSYLINLEHGLSIKFNYVNSINADFETFKNTIADVQFLNGDRPNDEKVFELLVDAWNFLAIEERLQEGDDLGDIGFNI